MSAPGGPLSVCELGAMLGLETGELPNLIRAAAGRNPRYGKQPAARPECPARGSSWTPHDTDAARSALRAEFAGLDGLTRLVLDAAAVAGETFTADMVAAACAVSTDEIAAAMETLMTRDLVREDQPHSVYLYLRHAALREQIYREIAPSGRRLLHSRLADLLRDQGAGPAMRARHVARSAQPGDIAAVELLVTAAEQIGPHAPGAAIEYLESARSLAAAREVEPGLRARMDLNLSRAYMWTGNLFSAREIMCFGAPAGASPDDQIRYHLVRARAERQLGRYQEAQAIVQSGLAASGAADPAIEAMLALEGGIAGALCGSPASADFVSRARRAVREVEDRALHVAVKIVGGFVAATWCADTTAVEELDSAAFAVDALPDGYLVHLMDPLALLAWAEIQLERDRDALRHLERALAVADRVGHVDLLPHLLAGRSYAASRLGRLAESAADAERAVEAARRLGTGAMHGPSLSLLAAARAYLSGPEAAVALIQKAVAVMSQSGRDWPVEAALRTSVRIRHAAGDPFDAVAALTKVCGGAEMARVEVRTRPYWCAVLAEWSLAVDRPDDALAWIERGAEFATGIALPGAAAHVRLARARHEAGQGNFAAACAHASKATEAFVSLGWIPAEIVARRLLAGLYGRLAAWDDMFAELAEARRLAEATGSAWLRQAVIADQRRLTSAAGVSTASRSSPLADLSPREAEIAHLATTGATNNEIAAKLHVTPKTVEAHLSRAYRKLGVRSRAMLATVLLATALPDRSDASQPR